MDWLNAGIAPLQELVAFLQKESKTSNIVKKQLIMELRDNLNMLSNGFLNQTSYDVMIDMLHNEAIRQAVSKNFAFRKLKPGTLQLSHIHDERNRKYQGWNAERIVDKIDEKIVELRNLKKMNGGTVSGLRNNLTLMMGNLYFRMKLLADFIQSQP